jgi:hypothetical protein
VPKREALDPAQRLDSLSGPFNIRQFLQGQLKSKAFFAEEYGGSQFSLITLIGTGETRANIFCVEIQMIGQSGSLPTPCAVKAPTKCRPGEGARPHLKFYLFARPNFSVVSDGGGFPPQNRKFIGRKE